MARAISFPAVGSDDESTREIEVEAMRDPLATPRATSEELEESEEALLPRPAWPDAPTTPVTTIAFDSHVAEPAGIASVRSTTTAVFSGSPPTLARREAKTDEVATVATATISSVEGAAGAASAPGADAPTSSDDLVLEVSDAEIEIVAEAGEPTSTRLGLGEPAPPQPSSRRLRDQAHIARAEASPLAFEDLDEEEAELLERRRFGPLVALFRQRLGTIDVAKKKAAILLKIARVYERGLDDRSEAFQALVDAFELAPDNAEVIAEIDRVGKAIGRIGELADRVKNRLLPGSVDDKRVSYLGHLVYWYERVLGRGGEVSSFVSEIERRDKVHPVVLERAARLAAMNGDTKTQREHLLRALERTTRREERAMLQVALASAFAKTPDELKYYEAALEDHPASAAALQGLKRLVREKENYDRVRWVLERQVEVAETNAERLEALLELAELQEMKFLNREAAADLLEHALTIEPAHPAALKALERCYHALRDWPQLARVLAVRAEQTLDKKTKRELLERAAEVHESKLGDPAGAVEVYKSLLVIEPKHRRALGDLARLYEKLGDWPHLALYKGRLAELGPTKRVSSQELVKLGDFLDTPERSTMAAKLQYERAAVVDPTNAAAWQALQKLAMRAGDVLRTIECLEQRRKHTDVPRQRAAVLVELGKIQRLRGNEKAARQAFEAAIQSDASNEAAAEAMLDTFTAEARWAEAAPLCELLVNAAIRDRDEEALVVRLRLGTRIAAALGDADRAMMSAVASFDARPKDAGARADLIAVATQCRESAPAALGKGRARLARMAEDADDLTPENLVRLASLQREIGELGLAAALFERIRRDHPDANVTKELAEVYLAQGDFPRACKLKVDMARNATSADTRFDLLCEAGEIWARRAEELETAASVFEEARALKPLDPRLLQKMMWLYGELGEWESLARVLDDMSRATQGSPAARVKTILAMLEVVRDKLGDRSRTADLYDQLLDIDKKRLDVFEKLVRMLAEEKDWERLARAYMKMIERLKVEDDEEGKGEGELAFTLLQQLGLIYRDRLEDAARAFDALDAASRIRPKDAEVRKIIVELLVVTDNLDSAVVRLRNEIDRDPHDGQLYAELYELFLRQHFFDKAWCAVNVLARLHEPTPEQRRFHEDYPPMPLDGVPGQIVEQAWRSHILHGQLDPMLTSLFALMTPVVARMRFGQLRPEQRVGRPFTPNHSRMHDVIRTTFENAAEILSVDAPELLLGDANLSAPFAPALAPFGGLLVSSAAVESQSSSLLYLVGKRLAEQRPELAARAFFPSVPELCALLNTAMRVGRNEIAKDPASAALDQSFAAALAPEESAKLRSIVLRATAENVTVDVKAWLRFADLSSTRAGLLIAGDVEPARNALYAEGAAQGGPAGEHAAKDRIGELFKFATSDLYSDLRAAIGVAVEA